MKIWITRHGQTKYNKMKLMQGRTDEPLNETGIAQAKAARERIGDVHFDAVYASPLDRAIVTGAIIGGVFSVLFSGNAGVSIGASGAIYGLLGAMLLLTKKRGARYTGMNYSTMLLLAATAIGFGLLQEGVDNFAHIGGFLGGIAVFSLLLRKK